MSVTIIRASEKLMDLGGMGNGLMIVDSIGKRTVDYLDTAVLSRVMSARFSVIISRGLVRAVS